MSDAAHVLVIATEMYTMNGRASCTHLQMLHICFFSHLLVVFGGLQGLEASLDADADLKVDDPRLLFHHYLNTCPQQGSHTIRTEVSEHMFMILSHED